MENFAKELLQIGTSKEFAEHSHTAAKRQKPLKCLVYWIDDKQVSIVNSAAVQGVKTADLKEGSLYRVKFQDKRVYEAKLIKMSDNVKELKQMQDEVAVSLAAASQVEATAGENPTKCSDGGNRRDNKRKKSTQDEYTEKVAESHGMKKKKEPVRNVDLSQYKQQAAAKAIAEREVFREMLVAEEERSAEERSAAPEAVPTKDSSPDKHLSADDASGITGGEVLEERSVAGEIRATPEAVHEKVSEPIQDVFQPLLSSTPGPPRLVDMLPPPPPSYTVQYPQPMYPHWQDQMSFGERIRDATNASTSILDPFQQDQMIAENEHLRQTIRQYESRIRALEEEKFRLTAVKDLYLPQVSARELKFLERLTSALGRCVNSSEQDWSEMTDQVVIQPGQSSVVEDAASTQLTSSLNASLSSQHSDTTESEMTEDMEEEKEVKVELVPGLGIFVSKAQYSLLVLQSKTKGARQLVRCLLMTLFSVEELMNGCAKGSRQAHNKGSRDKSRPLNPKKLNALKVFVLRKYKDCNLKDKDFNRIINCKCSELRATQGGM